MIKINANGLGARLNIHVDQDGSIKRVRYRNAILLDEGVWTDLSKEEALNMILDLFPELKRNENKIIDLGPVA